MPNTTFRRTPLHVVSGPTVSWIEPPARACALGTTSCSSSPTRPPTSNSVVFHDGARLIGSDRGGTGGVYSKLWRTSG